MQAKTSKLVASSIAALILLSLGAPTTMAAPNGASATQQTGTPDCKKDPTDPRCPKK